MELDGRHLGHPAFVDEDLRGYFPSKPRLNAGVHMVPIDREGVLFLGGESDVVMRGVGFRQLLTEIKPLLNGELKVQAILAGLPQWPELQVLDLLGNLYFNGILENGPVEPDEPSDTLTFIGRFCDTTRFNRNRYEAHARLGCGKVMICGPAHPMARAVEDLREAGVDAVVCREPTKAELSDTSLCVGVHVAGTEQELGEFFALADDSGVDALYAGFGDDAWQLGPVFVPHKTLGYIDLTDQGLTMGSAEEVPGLALGMLIQYILCFLSKVSPVVLIDRLVRFVGPIGAVRRTSHVMARYSARAADEEHHGLLGYLTAVSQPPKRFCPPKSYQRHYLPENMALAARPQATLLGSRSVKLPDPKGVIAEGAGGTQIDLGGLSVVLKAGFGEGLDESTGVGSARGHERENGGNGVRRRLAPTGGNLRSPECFLIVREIEGLAAGVYRYNASANALENIEAPVATLLDCFERGADEPAAVYVGVFGDLGKVRVKYGLYGLSIVCYDAGIAAQYVRIGARAIGVPVKDVPFAEGGLLVDLLGLPRMQPSLVFVEALGLGRIRLGTDVATPEGFVAQINRLSKLPVESGSGFRRDQRGEVCWPWAGEIQTTKGALASVWKLIEGRRSVRSFGRCLVSKGAVAALCGGALAHFSEAVRALGIGDSGTRVFVVVGDGVADAGPGIYRAAWVAGAWDLVKEVSLRDQEEVGQLTNQVSVGKAPVIVVPTIRIDSVLAQRGVRGFVLALANGGGVVAEMWIEAVRLGLVGVAYGGLIESELRSRVPSIGERDLALLAFAFGHRPQGKDGDAD